jgi:hypothetical protein
VRECARLGALGTAGFIYGKKRTPWAATFQVLLHLLASDCSTGRWLRLVKSDVKSGATFNLRVLFFSLSKRWQDQGEDDHIVSFPSEEY